MDATRDKEEGLSMLFRRAISIASWLVVVERCVSFVWKLQSVLYRQWREKSLFIDIHLVFDVTRKDLV